MTQVPVIEDFSDSKFINLKKKGPFNKSYSLQKSDSRI